MTTAEQLRHDRLETLGNMITLALGEDYSFVILIGKANDEASVNLLSNCAPAVTKKLLAVIGERYTHGLPKEL
jgi:hypothetical protein